MLHSLYYYSLLYFSPAADRGDECFALGSAEFLAPCQHHVQQFSITSGTSHDYWNVTWLLERHMTSGTSHDLWNVTWLLEHHMTTGTSHDYWNVTWLLECHMTTGMSHDFWNVTWLLKQTCLNSNSIIYRIANYKYMLIYIIYNIYDKVYVNIL